MGECDCKSRGGLLFLKTCSVKFEGACLFESQNTTAGIRMQYLIFLTDLIVLPKILLIKLFAAFIKFCLRAPNPSVTPYIVSYF